MSFYKDLETKFPLIPGRGYVEYVHNKKILNYLDFFNNVSIYYTIPELLLKNSELM